MRASACQAIDSASPPNSDLYLGLIGPARVGGTDFDIVIVGGGLVGLALARSLAGSGLNIALVERESRELPPSDPAWDVRVYAISPGSELFLRHLHAWPADEQRMAPVEHMS